jgi:hypothetical protein
VAYWYPASNFEEPNTRIKEKNSKKARLAYAPHPLLNYLGFEEGLGKFGASRL